LPSDVIIDHCSLSHNFDAEKKIKGRVERKRKESGVGNMEYLGIT